LAHFTTKSKLNIFRLPVGWQYLVDSPGATLNSANFGKYDELVSACLRSGAHCIIDIHNYARWNGQLIGSSGGPSNDAFANLWSQLATKYALDDKVVMGLMNEPHDCKHALTMWRSKADTSTVTDVTSWAASCQAAVNAIRKAGAKSQMILIPGMLETNTHPDTLAKSESGNGYTAAGSFGSTSGAAMATVTNPGGGTENLGIYLRPSSFL